MRMCLAVLTAAVLITPALPAQDPLATQVKAEAERRATADEFAGALLIARDGRTLYQNAYGYADRER